MATLDEESWERLFYLLKELYAMGQRKNGGCLNNYELLHTLEAISNLD